MNNSRAIENMMNTRSTTENMINSDFMVYQWTFTQEDDEAKERSESENNFCKTLCNEDLDAVQWGLDNYKFKKTAWISARSLGNTFHIGNNCDSYIGEHMQIDEDHFHSLSVGDLIVDCNTRTVHMVMKSGFKRVYLNFKLEMLREINSSEPKLH